MKLILHRPGKNLVVILIREGVTKGDTLSMVLYFIILIPMTEDPRAEEPVFIALCYADYDVFDRSEQLSVRL